VTRASITLALSAALGATLLAQGPPPGRGGGPPQTPRAAARADFTGTWVSVVSEDWRWRMITPPKGDFAGIPANAEARRLGNMWDPARDEAAGEQCRGYAAPAIMREPGRLRISWENDTTLKVDTDAGTQTRRFHFEGNPASAEGMPSWQGHSVARWETAPRAVQGNGIGLGLGPRAGTQSRTLEVTTTRLRPGYLRKNGMPFSAGAVLQEYFDLFDDQDGLDWFVVTSIVTDPMYLNGPWVTTSHFKKEPDASRFDPQPCRTR
jgi:hypothetical protein